MNYEQLKKNSDKINDILPQIIGEYKNKYVVVYGEKILYANNLDEAVELGNSNFGNKSGFAVKKVEYKNIKVSTLVANICRTRRALSAGIKNEEYENDGN